MDLEPGSVTDHMPNLRNSADNKALPGARPAAVAIITSQLYDMHGFASTSHVAAKRPVSLQAVGPARCCAPAVARRLLAPAPKRPEVRASFFTGGKDKNAYGFAGETREDYLRDDVNFYFEYMGLLADEKCYDRIEDLMATREPIDVILLLAAEGNDLPKIEEILNAGANPLVKSKDGRHPVDIVTNPEAKRVLSAAMSKVAA